MSCQRLTVGVNARLVKPVINGVNVESALRLRPGHVVEIQTDVTEEAPIRRACVASWTVSRLGSDGPTFAGVCEWI